MVNAPGFFAHGNDAATGGFSRGEVNVGELGEGVADLVIDGASSDPRIPERSFRLSRFTEGDLLTSPYPYVGAGEMR